MQTSFNIVKITRPDYTNKKNRVKPSLMRDYIRKERKSLNGSIACYQ